MKTNSITLMNRMSCSNFTELLKRHGNGNMIVGYNRDIVKSFILGYSDGYSAGLSEGLIKGYFRGALMTLGVIAIGTGIGFTVHNIKKHQGKKQDAKIAAEASEIVMDTPCDDISDDAEKGDDCMSEQFGARLRRIRESKSDYSQRDAAEKLLIDRTTYAEYELGLIMPPLDIIKKMCQLFQVDLTELV